MKLIDVRTPDEFELHHASGAINLPLADIENGVMPHLNKEEEIGVYCRSGARSEAAKAVLENNGYTNITNLGGLSSVV